MIIARILDILKSKATDIAKLWAEKTRKIDNMRRCHELTDEQLIELNKDVYPLLAAWCESEKDKNAIGGYFVKRGKDRLAQGFSISEAIMMLLETQRIVLDYVVEESITENSLDLYSLIELQNRISDFFMLGSFYVTKGFLEDAYIGILKGKKADEESIRQFLRDDFFFKDQK